MRVGAVIRSNTVDVYVVVIDLMKMNYLAFAILPQSFPGCSSHAV